MRESVSFWVVDDRGEIGLPRSRDRSGGRELGYPRASRSMSPSPTAVYFGCGKTGSRMAGAGARWATDGVRRRRRLVSVASSHSGIWAMTFAGAMVQTSSVDLVAGKKDGPLVDMEFEVEATMAAPPWIQGALPRRGRSATQVFGRR